MKRYLITRYDGEPKTDSQEFKNTQLVAQAYSGNLEGVKQYLKDGAEIDAVQQSACSNENVKLTALIAAIYAKNDALVLYLLRNRHPDVNLAGSDMKAPIFVAIDQNYEYGFRKLFQSKKLNLNVVHPIIRVAYFSGDHPKVLLTQQKSFHENWLAQKASLIKPATVYDMILDDSCKFSEQTKQMVFYSWFKTNNRNNLLFCTHHNGQQISNSKVITR